MAKKSKSKSKSLRDMVKEVNKKAKKRGKIPKMEIIIHHFHHYPPDSLPIDV